MLLLKRILRWTKMAHRNNQPGKTMRNLTILLVMLIAIGCTEQQRAKSLGGNATKNLEYCQKLVLITWKDDNLWFLTRPARQGETSDTYKFQENSSFGVLEGTVTVVEDINPGCFAS